MNVEPIINAKFKRFREKMELTNIADGVAFEQFVNHTILTAHQPDAFNGDNELFEKVNVGGTKDMGIDGIAIKLNGLFIRDIDEARDLTKRLPRISIEFIFIQSKYKSNFDKGEFNNFSDGVREFLSEKQKQPVSEEIKELIKIKEFLISENAVFKWDDNPSVRLYYVVMGKWHNSQHQLALADTFKEDILALNTYKEPLIHFVDHDGFKSILDSNENNFEVSINSIETMPLTSVDLVDNSCVLLCYASELKKILTTPDGLIRKSLFDDNVRDYQGDNSINTEISNTIQTEPQKFALLNNGITIVCEKYTPSNRQITLRNPQIVNGCQTSHVIFHNASDNDVLSRVPIVIKLISTNDSEITNQIVRGTNRQNIVYDEAFEATKKFHKDLEDFINALSPEYERFYYERRSKQYDHNPSISHFQKLNLRIIIQSFIGMFVNEPHISHRHESKLLELYSNLVFQDFQSKLPYFTSALAFYKLEKLFRANAINKKSFYAFRTHLLMIFREITGGARPNINVEKIANEHSQLVLSYLKDEDKCRQKFIEASEIFEQARQHWVIVLKRDQYRIKDNKDFTDLLLTGIRKSTTITTDLVEDENYKYKGPIVKIFKDRFGTYCGFIGRNPNDIFFHSSSAKGIDLFGKVGHLVTYKVTTNPKNGQLIATDIDLDKI
ncbi:MAG: AIPR family protein [Bacteroidales bacterium]|nr:AIPR family protein [Bacteroidales bacterium]